MPKYAIFDLDNCLADDRARIPLINWAATDPDERYALYHSRCSEDPVGNLAKFRDVATVPGEQIVGATPVFFTARPDAIRGATITWIKHCLGVTPQWLFMRSAGDHRHSVELKRDMLAEFLRISHHSADDIIVAFDDRLDVVQMYQKEGIEAQVLAIHDVSAYAPPIPATPTPMPHAQFNERLAGMQALASLSTSTAPPAAKRAPDFLEAGAATFRERNAIYGDNYLSAGEYMAGLFPDGLALKTPDEWRRFCLFFHCAAKLQRYAQNLAKGGHADSAHDLMVYAAMLEEVTE